LRASRGQTTSTGSGEREAQPQRVCQLRLAWGTDADARQTVVLDGQSVPLGREAGQEPGFVLDDREVSRQHAIVEPDPDGGGYRLRDLGSRNGVFVGGRRAAQAPLRPGDVIRIGKCLLVYVEAEMHAARLLRPEAPPLLGVSIWMQRVRGE